MYRHDTFLHSNIHMVWGRLPGPIHGICHKQTLTCMGHTYTLDMTTLVGPWQEITASAHQLLLWTRCLTPFFIGLPITFLSINNIFIRVHVIVGFSTNATSKQWLSLVVLYIISNNLTNMQYPMHAIHILMHFKHKLRKCSYNQQDRVLRKTSFSSLSSLHGTTFPHSGWLTS